MKRLALFVALLAVGWVLMGFNGPEEEVPPLPHSVQEWQKSGRYFSVPAIGHKVFYHDVAGNPESQEGVVFIIHGYPSSSYDFIRVWPQLQKRFSRVIAYDMLGFGLSDKPQNFNYTIHAQADIAEALLTQLGVQKYHLLSHDLGDSVAQELVARLQERKDEQRVSSWLILNGGVFPELHRPRLVQTLLLNNFIGQYVTKFITYGTFKRSFGEIFGPGSQPKESEFEEQWALICYNRGHLLSHKLIKYIEDRAVHRDRWVSALVETKIPTLFLNGPFDPVSGKHMLEKFRQLVPTQRAASMAGEVGHYPQLEAPKEMIAQYFRFLDELSSSSSSPNM